MLGIGRIVAAGVDATQKRRVRVAAKAALQDPRELGVPVRDVLRVALGEVEHNFPECRQRRVDDDGLLEAATCAAQRRKNVLESGPRNGERNPFSDRTQRLSN